MIIFNKTTHFKAIWICFLLFSVVFLIHCGHSRIEKTEEVEEKKTKVHIELRAGDQPEDYFFKPDKSTWDTESLPLPFSFGRLSRQEADSVGVMYISAVKQSGRYDCQILGSLYYTKDSLPRQLIIAVPHAERIEDLKFSLMKDRLQRPYWYGYMEYWLRYYDDPNSISNLRWSEEW